MGSGQNLKKIPLSILIFGAASRVGSPLTKFLTQIAPDIRLRLVTSQQSKVLDLKLAWPLAEVVVADYFDLLSLHAAVQDMEAVFLVTSTFVDERPAMTNIITALKASNTKVVHVIRLLGLLPGVNMHFAPQALKDHGLGLPFQHLVAKEVLDNSLLPVTHLNVAATFIDNFFWKKRGLQERQELVWPDRLIPYVLAEDVGEVAARLFLSKNHRHIGQFHSINNGIDLLRFSEVTELMTRVWNVKISHDSSKEGFLRSFPKKEKKWLENLWAFLQYEETYEVGWAKNDFAERILGRKPKGLEEWLLENRAVLIEGK